MSMVLETPIRYTPQMVWEAQGKPLPPEDNSYKLRRLVDDQGWTNTYAALFGSSFIDALADHHVEAIEWQWNARLEFLNTRHPEYLAYFPIWSRGHMKSSVAERMAVVGCILFTAYQQPGYVLYIARNKDKVQEHVANIETLLGSERVRAWCPSLSNPQRTEITNQQRRWTSSFLKTEANCAIQGGTMDSGLAGSRIEETRPTDMFLDDIDGREDSPVIAENRFRQLTTEILPMRQWNTLVFWPQNLINRYSTMYRIQSGHARVLTNRKPTVPIPAVIDLVTEQRTVGGIVKDVYVSGRSTWHVWDAQRIQDEIDTEGLPAFLRESQHEVTQSKEGLMIHSYDDLVHPISVSEFAAVYGTRSMPANWPKEWGNDWARTKTAKHANVALWRTVSSQSTKRPGFTFYWHPMSFPANSQAADVAERVLSCLSPYITEVESTRLTSQVDRGYPRQTWADLRRDELIRANALQHTKTDLERFDYERAVLQEVFPQYTEPVLRRHNVIGGVNSHERDDIRLLYNQVYALQCVGINPGKFGGIEQLNRDFAVDYSLEHPFRSGVMGYSRTFVVVPDDTSQTPQDVNGVAVYPPEPYPSALTPDDLHDDKLIRYQFSNFRLRDPKLTETGEVIDDPLKMDDDFPQVTQMFAMNGAILNEPLSVEEEYKMLREENLPKSDADQGPVVMTKQRQQQMWAIDMKIKRELMEKHGDECFEPDYEDEDDGDHWWN